MVILISDKIDFKLKTVTRDKEGHNITKKILIYQEDIAIIHTPNIRAPKYIKQTVTELKGK